MPAKEGLQSLVLARPVLSSFSRLPASSGGLVEAARARDCHPSCLRQRQYLLEVRPNVDFPAEGRGERGKRQAHRSGRWGTGSEETGASEGRSIARRCLAQVGVSQTGVWRDRLALRYKLPLLQDEIGMWDVPKLPSMKVQNCDPILGVPHQGRVFVVGTSRNH